MSNSAAGVAPRKAASPLAAVITLCLGGLAAALTQTVVIPIQPELPDMLHTDASNASWVITITLLAAAVTMVVSGRLGDMFGKQRVLLGSATVLMVGSAVCALSDTLAPMLAGRALQGLAMGFIPVGISMIREITPPKMAATSVSAMSATMGVGGAIGLPLSAWIVGAANWHILFWISTGLAALIVVLVWLTVPHVNDAHPAKLDVVGIVLLTIGLVAFLVGVSKGNVWGWTEPKTLVAIIGGVLVLLAFGAYELRQADPLVDLRTSARRPVLMTNIAAIAIGFGMMAQSIVFPQLLQLPTSTGYGLGQTMLHAGLWMAPGGMMMLVFAPVSARLIRTVGARSTLMIGASVIGGGYLLAIFLMDAPWQIMVAGLLASAGVGIGYAAMPTLIMDNTPMREAGAAVGLNSLCRSLGTTIAAAVMGAIMSSRTMALAPGVDVPTQDSFVICFVIGGCAAFLGVVLAGFGRTKPAVPAATPEPELVSTTR